MRVPSRSAPIDLAVDTSALISILKDEPTCRAVKAALAASAGGVVSTATMLEATMVAFGKVGDAGTEVVDDICRTAGLVTMPIDDLQLAEARAAFAQFGKGRHPAGLNFGDCFSYALAAHFDVPLLCTGDDFARTGLWTVPLS